MNFKRDNLKAGLFVLVGLALLMVVMFTLADLGRIFEKKQTVQVVYQLSDGLQGLKQGAVVTLGGQPIGVVSQIDNQFTQADGSQRVTGKCVSFTMPARYTLFQNAQVELVVPPLGTGTMLNIRSVGDGPAYQPDQPLNGYMAGSVLTANLLRDTGIEDQQRRQIRQIIANLSDLSLTLRNDVPQLTSSVRRVLAEAEPLAADARAAVADLRDATAKISAIVADVQQHSPEWIGRVDRISAAADDSLTRVSALLADHDQDLRQTLSNVSAAVSTVQTLLTANRPLIERMLASLHLASTQLKLATIEIRRSPWRLLYHPTDKELDSENLYDAARSFALAAESVDASVQSLQAIQAGSTDHDPQIDQTLDYLQSLLGRFQEVEKGFWDALDQQASAE